ADRQFWAWKLIDFPNGTFQGFANGLSSLLANEFIADTLPAEPLIHRIRDYISAIPTVTRRDGSLEEAFPFEKSFCVTALVAYDALRTLENLSSIKRQDVLPDPDKVIGPLIRFVVRADETHGLISNHLATAVAALARWHLLTGESAAKAKAESLLDRILNNQSEEGWFREYDGADPGYQTLCVSYLADVTKHLETPRLDQALEKSTSFLVHFVNGDGSFAGLYGSRGTRLYYPAGLEELAPKSPESEALAVVMRDQIQDHRTVPLTSIDAPNLSPVFNNYCQALAARHRRLSGNSEMTIEEARRHIPAFAGQAQTKHYPSAGLIVDSGPSHHTVVSTAKGGMIHHAKGGTTVHADWAFLARDKTGRFWSTQHQTNDNQVQFEEDKGLVTVQAEIRSVSSLVPTPVRFVLLRLLNLTVMRLPAANEIVKRLLVRLLITGKGKPAGHVTREIRLGEEPRFNDQVSARIDLRPLSSDRPYCVIHMASQGYWQIQDAEAAAPKDGGTG
ncbi:MAG: hypothetical protein AAGF58_08905, partial [Pseudomonadota bacterium]